MGNPWDGMGWDGEVHGGNENPTGGVLGGTNGTIGDAMLVLGVESITLFWKGPFG